MMSVGVSVGRAVGRFLRCVWSIICTRVDPHGSWIVMCDRCVVRQSFLGREQLYNLNNGLNMSCML